MTSFLAASRPVFKVDYHQVMSGGLTAPEVSARLGVKLDTVYAYVSRGVLSSRPEPGSRRRVFDADEVEALARRGRPRRGTRPAALDLVVESELTTIAGQQIRYRGRDVAELARTRTFEEAAQWLWTGQDEPAHPWLPYPVSLPDLEQPRDRIRAAVVLASAAEPMRADLSPPAVTAAARSLIASMVGAVTTSAVTTRAVPGRPGARTARLVLDGGRPPVAGSVAGRLWGRLTDSRPSPGLVATLNAALVLLADHELASSTVAARVAASVRADPFSVVLAGLGPIAGPLHGSASVLAGQLIADAVRRGPERAVAAVLGDYGFLPGFGHRLYPAGDPRAVLLLHMIGAAAPGAPGLRAVRALIDAARRHSGTEPNVDFAVGALTTVARMPPEAGETIFTIARTAGWIAHALEEYTEPPVRFRARAIPRGAKLR
jgi:citrate synthase